MTPSRLSVLSAVAIVVGQLPGCSGGTIVTSSCGDQTCNGTETCSDCPADCNACSLQDAGSSDPDAGSADPDAGFVDPDAGSADPDAGFDPDAADAGVDADPACTTPGSMASLLQYGAVGDGVADDTLALAQALSSGQDFMIPAGTYRVTDGILVDAGAATRVVGCGTVTLSLVLPANVVFLKASRAVAFENVTFDFNHGYARGGLHYGSDCGAVTLHHLRFRNVKDLDSSYSSVLVYVSPVGNTFDIHDVAFDNCLKLGNGTITDGAGNLTCIYVHGDSHAQGTIDTVRIDDLHNINGAGQIVMEDTSGIYVATPSADSANRVTIRNVSGNNFGKRLIKIHASNVTIETVTGTSDAGDSLAVIGFNNGEGLGEKTGSTVSHAHAYGIMQVGFANDAVGTRFYDVTASTMPSANPDLGNCSFGMLISNDNTVIEGYESDSQRMIGLGSTTRVVRNTTLRNLKFHISGTTTDGFQIIYGMQGLDGLFIDGLDVDYDATSSSIPAVQASLYLDEDTRGNDVVVRNCRITSASPAEVRAFRFAHCDNVSLQSCSYANTNSFRHGHIATFEDCSNVSVEDMTVEGACQSAVYLDACTGANPMSSVHASDTSIAAVYSVGSSGVTVQDCTSYLAN